MLAIPMCWCGGNANFGDWIGPYLVEKTTGYPAVRVDSGPGVLITAGSILNWATAGAVVWGAGLARRSDNVDPRADIRAVRGPVSRSIALKRGANCPKVFGDPALLLPKFIPRNESVHEIGIVPHYADYPVVSQAFENQVGVHVVDVLQAVDKVVSEITSCGMIYSSSLHGLIVADAYGIQNCWVKFSNSVLGDGTKFHDHLMATRLKVYEPQMMRWGEQFPPIHPPADQEIIAQLTEGLWASKPF